MGLWRGYAGVRFIRWASAGYGLLGVQGYGLLGRVRLLTVIEYIYPGIYPGIYRVYTRV